jgi:hypothetical protein
LIVRAPHRLPLLATSASARVWTMRATTDSERRDDRRARRLRARRLVVAGADARRGGRRTRGLSRSPLVASFPTTPNHFFIEFLASPSSCCKDADVGDERALLLSGRAG